MNLDRCLKLIAAGDRLSLAGESLSDATLQDRQALTRTAARLGQTAVLRDLFERCHLYDTEPDERGRTLLHEAASSGSAETTAWVMDVVGFDPLQGDVSGVTALDAAKGDALAYLQQRLGFTLEETYRNPVLRGFHPDPSVVRVEEDYYLINSSFVYFPALPIYHSRDLVHWTPVGHAVEQLAWSGLDRLPGGYGYWAPDISWFEGRFWVTATLRRNTPPYRLQLITCAESPRGPWRKPIFLPLDGIDPSLFTDSDGRRYILLNPGAIMAEIDREGQLISAPRMLRFGAAHIKPEGPHLLRKDGWYYLFLAEGGTGEGHMETVLRSKRLDGPYEACPFNPILGKKNPLSPIQRSGHGKPVQTPDGRWYMVYLCGRKVEGKTVMGRETALDPITWTADGWPMVNRLQGPSCLQRLPFPGGTQPAAEAEPWISPRSDPADFCQTSASGLRLACGVDPAGLSPCSLLLHRQKEAVFVQSALVDLSETSENSFAGLAGYYDERSFFLFGVRKANGSFVLELQEQIGPERRKRVLSVLPAAPLRLWIEGRGLSRRLGFAGGDAPFDIRCEYLCDEGAYGDKCFTGALLGLFAIGEGCASFDQYAEEMRSEPVS